jgi:ankyrin repeat protein
VEVESWAEVVIILSSFQGSEQCLELLIGHFGPSIVNLRDHRGCTPLHVAAFYNNLDCMQLLLSHGASVEARDVTGKTPLLLAAYSGQCNAIGECCCYWEGMARIRVTFL